MRSIRGNLAIILAAVCLAGIPAVSYYQHTRAESDKVGDPAFSNSMPPGPGSPEGFPGSRRGWGFSSPEAFRERFGTAENFADHYLARDTNGDGVLDETEMSERLAQRLLPIADLDHSRSLTRDELVTYAEGRLDGSIAGPYGSAPAPGNIPGSPPPAPGFGNRPWGAGPIVAAPPQVVVTELNADDMTFAQHMAQAQLALDELRRSALDDASRKADVQHARTIQHALIHAKAKSDTIPMAPQAKAVYGDDYDAYLGMFQQRLIAAISNSLSLEAALLSGDADAARSALDQLVESQTQGHREFRETRREAE